MAWQHRNQEINPHTHLPNDAEFTGNFFLLPTDHNTPVPWEKTVNDTPKKGKPKGKPASLTFQLPENHILTNDYPYGQIRCMKAQWIERKHGQMRSCYATTDKHWNTGSAEKGGYDLLAHTFRVKERTEENLKTFESELATLEPPRWNRPAYSVYQEFVLLYFEKNTGYVKPLSMSMYVRPEDFVTVKGMFTYENKTLLDESQQSYLREFERLSRRTSPYLWEEWDRKNNETCEAE